MHKTKYKKTSSKIAKRRKVKKYASVFLKISVPTVLFIGLVFLLQADFLQVKSFEVIGAETISEEKVKNIAASFIAGNKFLVIPKSDILVLNKNQLATALLSKFPRIQKVDISKQYFNESIKLSVTERKADFLWCFSQGECFSMTKDGLVFEKSELTPFVTDAVVFRGNLQGSPLMKNFAPSEKMQNYSGLIKVFKDARFDVISINIESTDKAIAKTKVGDVIFDPEAFEKQPFILTYVKWHYGGGLQELFGVSGNFLWFVANFFSFKLLLKTWFAPWKRMGEHYEGGFDLSAFASTIVVNTLMRIVGFITKTLVLIVGLITYLLVAIFSLFIFIIWILAPAILLGSLILAFTFFIV